MSRLAHWFQSLRRPMGADKPSSMAKGFRPRLEVLEDRTVMSTLTVLNNLDSGVGSLRNTLAAAQHGDSIAFAPSVHSITLTTGELVVTTNLNINGPGANKLTISGNGASRVFHIESGNTVTIAGLTITDGLASGPLASSIVGTYAGAGTGAGGGGGILNEAGATLTLSQDTISNNQAVHGSSPLAFTVLGGGLLNLGTATIQACRFSSNEAEGGNGADNIGGSAGGAIDNFGGPTAGAKLRVAGTTFSNNSAVAGGGGYFFGVGGALESDAGLNGFTTGQAEPSSATLTNCTFVNNLATGGLNALANGGALVSEGDGVTMTLVACTINGNRSVGGGGGDGVTTGDSQGVGGGIAAVAGTLTIVGCTITNNQAIGGANTSISDADTLAGAAFGGGIENNFDNVLFISNSVIANNLAKGGATTAGPGADALGGGISNSPSATMTMTNCTVANNSAIAGHGGPGANSQLVNSQAGFAFGGGVDVSRGSTATIIASTIAGNDAIGGAAGAGNTGGNGYGGGLGVEWGPLAGFSGGATLNLIDSQIMDNLAEGGAGANGGDGLGGGLFVNDTGSADSIASLFEGNSAVGGKAGAGGHSGLGHGGGVYYEVTGAFVADLATLAKNNHTTPSDDDVFLP